MLEWGHDYGMNCFGKKKTEFHLPGRMYRIRLAECHEDSRKRVNRSSQSRFDAYAQKPAWNPKILEPKYKDYRKG